MRMRPTRPPGIYHFLHVTEPEHWFRVDTAAGTVHQSLRVSLQWLKCSMNAASFLYNNLHVLCEVDSKGSMKLPDPVEPQDPEGTENPPFFRYFTSDKNAQFWYRVTPATGEVHTAHRGKSDGWRFYARYTAESFLANLSEKPHLHEVGADWTPAPTNIGS